MELSNLPPSQLCPLSEMGSVRPLLLRFVSGVGPSTVRFPVMGI